MKYRLILPDNIGLVESQWEFLRKIESKVVKVIERQGEYYLISQWNYDYPIFKVFKDWLEPIEDGPETIESVAMSNLLKFPNESAKEQGIRFVRAGEANHAKRTQALINNVKDYIHVIDEHESPLARCYRGKFTSIIKTMEES